jgi:hypothetical protein
LAGAATGPARTAAGRRGTLRIVENLMVGSWGLLMLIAEIIISLVT